MLSFTYRLIRRELEGQFYFKLMTSFKSHLKMSHKNFTVLINYNNIIAKSLFHFSPPSSFFVFLTLPNTYARGLKKKLNFLIFFPVSFFNSKNERVVKIYPWSYQNKNDLSFKHLYKCSLKLNGLSWKQDTKLYASFLFIHRCNINRVSYYCFCKCFVALKSMLQTYCF